MTIIKLLKELVFFIRIVKEFFIRSKIQSITNKHVIKIIINEETKNISVVRVAPEVGLALGVLVAVLVLGQSTARS